MKSMKQYTLDYKKLPYGLTVTKQEYIVYKKVQFGIAQLLLPIGTEILKADNFFTTSRMKFKLRSNKALTILILPYHRSERYNVPDIFFKKETYRSLHLISFKYTMGKLAKTKLNKNVDQHCGSGIHFFCTLEEAENY